jgi:hypothetical protein
MLPLLKANRPPATPASAPAMTKATHCTCLTSMPMASARSGESRPARIAKPKGENSTRRSSAMPASTSTSVKAK